MGAAFTIVGPTRSKGSIGEYVRSPVVPPCLVLLSPQVSASETSRDTLSRPQSKYWHAVLLFTLSLISDKRRLLRCCLAVEEHRTAVQKHRPLQARINLVGLRRPAQQFRCICVVLALLSAPRLLLEAKKHGASNGAAQASRLPTKPASSTSNSGSAPSAVGRQTGISHQRGDDTAE
eukprot:scaffold2631_cov412-Prasinococcus_capsulatus_cf.AAC.26